jgi:hypothetical protein
VLALCLGGLASAGLESPAHATQAPGTDAVVWQTGWSWTYATTFRYSATDANATVNENLTATVAGVTTFNGQSAYQLNLSGNVTGGSGSASGQNLTIKGGNVSGTRYIRRSDLALLQEHQVQHITGCAGPFCAVGVTADVDLTLNPTPTWHQHDFPLNAGDAWQVGETINYDGSFTYDAGSIGGSGGDTLNGSIPLDATAHVSNQTISTGAGSVSTQLVDATSGDTISRLWWSAAHKNDARDYMKLPLDGATLEMDRVLSSSSTPAPANTITENMSDSLTCAGDTVTVSGSLSTAASGVGVTVSLDRSQIGAGTSTVSTTTGSNGVYSATITAPGQSDGLAKNGSRANWGVLVSAPSGGATNVKTLVVSPKDCSTLAYTGPSSGAQLGNTSVSAKLTDLASAGGAAGRTVTFSLAGGSSVSAVTDASGDATASLPIAGPPRSTSVTVSFAGAGDLEAATDSAPFTVTKATSSTTVAPSSPTVTIGDPVTFTASVSPSAAGGNVQFKVDGSDFGAAQPLAGGTATSQAFGTGTLGIGNHTVQAVYNGDADYLGSTSPAATFRVRNPLLPTTTTEVAAPASVVTGQTVTLSADVSAGSGTDPVTGSVTFTDGADVLGEVAVDGAGHAALDVADLTVGSHSIVAAYSGDDVYNASTSAPATVSVAKADVQVGLSTPDNHTVTGQAVNFTATVGALAPGAGTPSGTVQLVVDGTDVGGPVALVNGAATFDPLTTLGAGDHTVTVAYGGDAGFRSGSASATQHVIAAATTTSLLATPSPSAEDQAVTLTATVAADAPGSGAPTGTILFSSDGEVIGAAPLSAGSGGSQATIEISTLAPGSHTLAAWYAGDTDFHGSQSADVSHTVIAAYLPTAGYSASGDTLTQTVADAEVSVGLASSDAHSDFGEDVTFTATVASQQVGTGTPGGYVQFRVDGAPLGDAVELVDGAATSPSIGTLEPGSHAVTALYSGDTHFAPGSASLTQDVAKVGTSTALAVTPASPTYGDTVVLTATVTPAQANHGAPTGTVTFRDGSTVLATVPVTAPGGNATASVSRSDLGAGSHHFVADYSGSAAFAASTSATKDVTVARRATSLVADAVLIRLNPLLGINVGVLRATLTTSSGPLPGQTVVFKNGATTACTATTDATGLATCTPALTQWLAITLAGGFTADYAGNANYLPSSAHGSLIK